MEPSDARWGKDGPWKVRIAIELGGEMPMRGSELRVGKGKVVLCPQLLVGYLTDWRNSKSISPPVARRGSSLEERVLLKLPKFHSSPGQLPII